MKTKLDIYNIQFEKEEIDELKWIDIDKVRKILMDLTVEDWVKKPWD